MAIYTLQPGQPQQIIYAAVSQSNPPVTEYVISNLDQQDLVYIGAADAADQQPDLTADLARDILAPLQSVTVRATMDWWALNVSDDTIAIDVIPEGISETADPIGSALAFISAGVPAVIAAAITGGGLSLVGAPKLLYGGGSGGTGGTQGTNFIGARVDPKGYNPPPPAQPVYNVNDFVGPSQFYDSVCSRIIAQQGTKWYWAEGQLETTVTALGNDWPGLVAWMQQTVVPTMRVIASIRPDRTGVNAGGTLNAHGTSQAATLAAMLAMLKTNFTNVTFLVTLWQEPQGHENNGAPFFPFTYTPAGGSPQTITYDDYVAAYGPTVTAAALPLVYDCLLSPEQYPECVSASFFNPARPYTHFYCDYYATSYKNGVRLNAAFRNSGPAGGVLSLAESNNLIFGLAEYGDSASGTPTDQPTYSEYCGHIISTFSGITLAASQGGDITWFSGTTYHGNNIVLSSGLASTGVDLTGNVAAGDLGIDDIYDAVSNSTGTGGSGGGGSGVVTIPAGGSLNVTPLNPTPGGGYALANGLSYDILILGQAGAGSTIPFVTVQMLWKNTDQVGSKVIHEERWTVPLGASTSSGTLIGGRGPMHGQFLNIKLVNQDTVPAQLTIQVNQTGRPVAQHDWYWDAPNSVAVPGYTLPINGAYSNELLAIDSLSVPAGGTASKLASMFAGAVDCRFGGGGGFVTVTMQVQPSSVFGTINMFNELLPGTGDINIVKYFPRAPVLVTFANSDTGPHNVNTTFVALDRGMTSDGDSIALQAILAGQQSMQSDLSALRVDVSRALTHVEVIDARNKTSDEIHRDVEARLRILERFRFTLAGVSALGGIVAGAVGYWLGHLIK